jgi:uncharacterized protein
MEPTEPKTKPFFSTRILLFSGLFLFLILVFVFYQRFAGERNENRSGSLEPTAFQPLPLGRVKPKGWLLEQMKLQAAGLSGHLDEFWPDVKDSGWIGGQAEGWERAPYWLDGLVPLAFLTDDARLKQKANRWIDYILKHQLANGWLGPEQSRPAAGTNAPPPEPRDPWPQFVILKVLSQYEEATGDKRVILAMEKNMAALSAQMDARPLFAWNFFRWGDFLSSLFWLYDRKGESWIPELAKKTANQGYNWPKHFSDLPVKERSKAWNWEGHVVNNAMGLKTPALLWRLTGEKRFKKIALGAYQELERWHGEANGLFSGDECLAGKNPSQGTELCAIVEAMFSLETQISILGDVESADRLEKIAFNALPAAFSSDYWLHQYVEQSNQAVCGYVRQPVYTTNGGGANTFGLEPQYGCCTANLHQGWPKLASHLWMASPDGGLAAVAYAPSIVETEIAGVPVRVELATDYPFSEELVFQVETGKLVSFPLYLRVPAWARGATLKLPDGSSQNLKAGSFHKVQRQWTGKEKISLRLPMAFQVRRGFQNSVSVERGPLVFSLGIKEQWKVARPFRFQPKGAPKNDYMVLPESNWNYALALNPKAPEKFLVFEGGVLKGNPFTPTGAPVKVRVQGKILAGWTYDRGAAQPPPVSPVASDSPLESLVLVPYGATRLRITEFPLLDP